MFGDMAQLVERYVRNVQATSSNLVISTKRELSEHHYYRTVGSGSFFIAAEGITLRIFCPSLWLW